MILLIQYSLLDLYQILYIFKFHYDSINSTGPVGIAVAVIGFKFHYDSINSDLIRLNSIQITNLNSIMILLILSLQVL